MMEDRKPQSDRRCAGFTLVELMAASAAGLLLILSVMSVLLYQLRTSQRQEMLATMQENVRTALDLIAMDTYMAGYGIPVSESQLPAWIPWVSGMTNNPYIVQGVGTAPDTLYVAGAFGPPEATLSQHAARTTTTLRVDGSTPNLNLTDRSVLFIGRREVARVVSIFGSELTITTDPSFTGHGLKRNYPAGTEVELVRVVNYNVKQLPSQPYMRRTDSAQSYSFDWQRRIGSNIEDFQMTQNGDVITISVTGRTEHPESKYTHPVAGDHFRRVTLQRSIAPRN